MQLTSPQIVFVIDLITVFCFAFLLLNEIFSHRIAEIRPTAKAVEAMCTIRPTFEIGNSIGNHWHFVRSRVFIGTADKLKLILNSPPPPPPPRVSLFDSLEMNVKETKRSLLVQNTIKICNTIATNRCPK